MDFVHPQWCRATLNPPVIDAVLGPPVVPFYPFLGEGSPTKIDCRKNRVPTYSNLSKAPNIRSRSLSHSRDRPPAATDRFEAQSAADHARHRGHRGVRASTMPRLCGFVAQVYVTRICICVHISVDR